MSNEPTTIAKHDPELADLAQELEARKPEFELKPYASYNDSGVPWIGKIPAHWEMQRAKWLFQRMQRPVRSEDETVTCFRDGTVTLRRNRRLDGFTESLKEIGYQGVRIGDLVLHGMDAFAGAIGVSDSEGKCSPVYSVCKPREKANSRYYAHLLQLMSRAQWILALAKGIRERSTDFRYSEFADQWLPLPPRDEQDAIVRFLDYADRRINRYIAAKQKLIKLLEEQKQAIIHQAVTRGLNPNVPLKPSGVDWMGDVPEHWYIQRLSKLTTKIGDGLHGTPAYADESDYRFINGNNLSDGSIVIDERTRCVPEYEFRKHQVKLDCKTVLLSINGTIGSAALYKGEPVILGKSAAYIKCDRQLRREFLLSYLQTPATKEYYQMEVTGTTIFNLSLESIRNMTVPVPPLSEQTEISMFVTCQTSVLRDLTLAAKREIALMNEYRTHLIADVVTGKLDVREAAAALPAIAAVIDSGAEIVLDDSPGGIEDDTELVGA